MVILPTGFRSLEAMLFAALLVISIFTGNFLLFFISIALIAVVLPHRLEFKKTKEFSV